MFTLISWLTVNGLLCSGMISLLAMIKGWKL